MLERVNKIKKYRRCILLGKIFLNFYKYNGQYNIHGYTQRRFQDFSSGADSIFRGGAEIFLSGVELHGKKLPPPPP